MGGSQRRKGARGERELAAALRQAMPELADNIRRGWQSRLGTDDPDVCGMPGLWLEHKTGKLPNMRAALRQARVDARRKGACQAMPCAIIQDDHARERMVVLGLPDFLRIMRAAYGYTEPLRFGVQADLFEETGS